MRRDTLDYLGAGVVVAVLIVASAIPAPHALLWPDTIRDLSASLDLARGREIPLVGPPVNLGPHLGPAWICLQSLVLVVAPTLTATSVYVALIAGLRFWFLYLLGRVISGPRMGICFAIAGAIPSIAVFQWYVFWHPNWVETGILGSLVLLALAIRTGSIRTLYASALVLGLAIQFHPTALFYAPLVVFAFARRGARGPRLVLHVAGLFAALAVWFVPLPFATTTPHGQEMQAGASRVAAGMSAFRLTDVLTVLRTAYLDVPMAIGETYGARMGIGAWPWLGLVAATIAVPATGLVLEIATNRDGRRRLIAVLVAALLAGWTIATAVRTYTSFYLCYFLLPLSSVLVGFGLVRVTSSRVAVVRFLGHATAAAALVTFVLSAFGAREVGASGYIESRLPLLQDLRHPGEGKVSARWIGAAARDAMARFVCGQRGEASLHGEWAYALAGSTGLDHRMRCPGDAGKVRILGDDGNARGWTLLAPNETGSLGRKPEHHFRRLGAFPVRASLHPARGRAIEPDWHHFEVLRDRQPMSRTSLSFETGAGEALAIFRLKPFDSRWENLRVERDGVPATPSLSTYNSGIYVTGPGAARTRWRVDFDTDAPQWVDVHVF